MDDRIIGVVGAGYVGLTAAASLAHLGHRVRCADSDAAKVEQLRLGRVGLAEPGLADLVYTGLASQRLRFTTDLKELREAEFTFLCLPTPMADGGGADLGAVTSVLGELAGILPRDAVLVTKSTVPVGTAGRLRDLLGRPDVSIVSNPEFLQEGRAVRDFLRPDRIVIGAADRATGERVAALYEAVDAPVLHVDPASAELSKYAANAFLALKASYVNELAELCERLGADIGDVVRAMGMDERIGTAYLSPGPGWGGSCLPKDTTALLRAADGAGLDLALVRDAVAANEKQRERIVRKVRLAVTGDAEGSIDGVRIGLLGLAFKAGTADLRRSPALEIAWELAAEGAVLTGYDPCVKNGEVGPVRVVDDPYLVAKDAAGLVLLTEWPEFLDLDWARLEAVAEHAVLVDTRNLLDAETLSGTGFVHIGVGHPSWGPAGAAGPRDKLTSPR